MLPDEKESLVEIQNDESQIPSESVEQVVVDLDKKSAEKLVDPKTQVPPKQSEDITKLHNTIAYQTRKLDQAMRELQNVKDEIANSRNQKPVQEKQDVDEIDEIALRDWKKGVTTLVDPVIEKRVEEILKKRDDAQVELNRRTSLNQELEKSKQRVISKYPNLEDESTEESNIYRQVLNEDSSILSNVHGPEIAMYRMEDRMREMGKTPPSLKPVVDREVNRLVRAGASSVVGRTPTSPGKLVLTKEQKTFCDQYGIPYDRYVKNLKASANGESEL